MSDAATEPNAAGQELSDPLSMMVQTRDADAVRMVEDAVRHSRVRLAYQPVVLSSNPHEPAFNEGLLRVIDATGRTIPARDFIGAVETSELGRKLDCIALSLGLEMLSQVPDLRLAINMSARSIGYGNWRKTLEAGIEKDATAAERLILEITETSAMQVPDLVSVFMSELQAKGITFALDHFGAGFTAFRHLRDFYFDIMKIDGQFVRGICQTPDNQVLTRALVAVAKQFDMFTVAQSVENAEDGAFLASIGVDCLQGYYTGAPTISPEWLPGAGAKRDRKAG